jgi:hypothetical protein
MGLWSEFLTNSQRPIHKWTHYLPIYERHFNHLVNRTVTIIEIGVYKGGSLQFWKRYFGPFAVIVGIDIDPACAAIEEDQIAVRIGDQSDPSFLERILQEFGAPDIVIDDGSHKMRDQRVSFAFLYPRMDKNGIYVVEDMHTSYWPEYGGGFLAEGSFIERCKSLIDELNAEHSRGAIPPTNFTKTTMSMHFYDSVAVFERGCHLKKHALLVGQSDTTIPSRSR